jgi:hypothetical protein
MDTTNIGEHESEHARAYIGADGLRTAHFHVFTAVLHAVTVERVQ